MNFHLRRLPAIALMVLAFLFPVLVLAVAIDNPLQVNTVVGLINIIIDIIFNFSLWVAPLMIIVAGFYFVTAAGNPNQINTAKQLILWTLIGLVIVFLARGIVGLLISFFA